MSIEGKCYQLTISTLQEMVRQGVFRPVGTDTLRGLESDSQIIGRLAVAQARSEEGNQGESNLPLPCILVTHVRNRRPVSGGEHNYDDGIIEQLIQICDRLDGTTDANILSYLQWQTDIREHLQANPYRGSTHPDGNAFLVHVTDQVSAGNETYLIRQCKLALQVNIHNRTRIDKDKSGHDY